MNDLNFHYRIIRSQRRTIAIQITPTGEVLVRCPSATKTADIHRFVADKSQWIEKHLSRHIDTALPPFTKVELQVLATQARDVIPERVRFFAPQVGVTYGNITIRCQRSRWGSCSSKGNLNFNCLLMLSPPEVQDYVVVHELCHRTEMNHSSRFWAQVERILPDYRTAKRWLKDHGDELIRRLPGTDSP